MTRKRGYISFKTKLVATLCQMRHEVDGKWELILTNADAQALSEDQILSIFHFDHDPIPHAEGGEDTHYNLVPTLIPGHRKKTAEVDTPGIAKRKRVSAAQEEFRKRMLTPRDERPKKQSRWGKRPLKSKSSWR